MIPAPYFAAAGAPKVFKDTWEVWCEKPSGEILHFTHSSPRVSVKQAVEAEGGIWETAIVTFRRG